VRPTKVDVDTTWRKKFQKSLLSTQEETTLDADALHTAKNAAFDLREHFASHLRIAGVHN
jgi:hypothetical protein